MVPNNIEFIFSKERVSYNESLNLMTTRVIEILNNHSKELIWFLEHPLTFTAGTSAKANEIKDKSINVINTNRGGKHTIHAPGQRVVYLLLNLKNRSNGNIPDVKKYVHTLEEIIINTLTKIGIQSERKEGRIGVWVNNKKTNKEEKIAAIGVRFSKGITMHGFAINVSNNLTDFEKIVPCGIHNYGVCSIKSLGVNISLQTIDRILVEEIEKEIQKCFPINQT